MDQRTPYPWTAANEDFQRPWYTGQHPAEAEEDTRALLQEDARGMLQVALAQIQHYQQRIERITAENESITAENERLFAAAASDSELQMPR
ncbi:unnamed protein product, partial [Polarella glacialis]